MAAPVPVPHPVRLVPGRVPRRPRARRGDAAAATGTASSCSGATTRGDVPPPGRVLPAPRRAPRRTAARSRATSSQCPFHGWRFDGDGRVHEHPVQPAHQPQGEAAHVPDDRAQRLRARVVPPVRRSAEVGDPGDRGDRRPGVERLLLVVVRDPHGAAGDVGERRRPRALPVRARHRRRRGDGVLRHRRSVLGDAVEAVVRHAARRHRRPHRRLQLRARLLEGVVQRHRRRDQHRDHDADRRRDARRCASTSSCASSTTRS